MIIDTINDDLKAAMLAGNKPLVETLKGAKTAIQYLAVSKGSGNTPSEDEVIDTLKKNKKDALRRLSFIKKLITKNEQTKNYMKKKSLKNICLLK